MGAGRAMKSQQSKVVNKRARQLERRTHKAADSASRSRSTRSARPEAAAAKPVAVKPAVLVPEKPQTVNVITWDDPRLDRRIIEGMLTDRHALLSELALQGITSSAVMRRAADLGLSEAYLRHVQTVAADLAGDRPGARRLPSSLAARNCLSCTRVFLSSGSGNRICPRCRGADAGLAQL